jgi:hypothetical protein
VTRPTPPTSYAEWLPLLEQFRDGNDTVLGAMQSGQLEWTNIVAERWTKRMADAFKVRLERISKQLQATLDRAGNDAFAISGAILAARRALLPLRAAAALKFLPDEVRNHFGAEVERFAKQTQESLESSAQRVRTDGGAMLKAIRDNPLTIVEPSSAPPPASDEPLPFARGRRVLE